MCPNVSHFQGRRKLLKVGGAGFEGHFSNKKGHQKNFPDTPKTFSRSITFFPKYEKNSPDIPKNVPDI